MCTCYNDCKCESGDGCGFDGEWRLTDMKVKMGVMLKEMVVVVLMAVVSCSGDELMGEFADGNGFSKLRH